MASPSTSSSTASPHPGQSAASSGGQLPGSAHPKMDSLRNGSYLEPIPLNYPKIIPLEWSFPLVHHVRTETTDSGSLKTTISAGPLADDFPSNANTPSLSSNLSARLPANVVTDLGVQTPSAAIAPVPSPAITSTISGANQAIVQTQKPWRIMWASYVMKAQDPATADQPASPNEPNRNTRESVRSTPHSSEFLQVPQSQPSNQLPEQKPSHEIITDRKKLTSRSRAGSSASRRSNDSPASVGQRPRKKRHRDGPPDLRSDSPDFLLGQYNGKERQSQYKQAIENLIRPTRTSRLDPLLAAKKRFLTRDESARKVDLSQDMQTDAVDSASDDLLCQHGRLPQRLALIEAGQASLPSKAPENKDDTPRLYTFSMTSPSVDLSEYPGLEANIFAGLELEASGSFTASDLFPALFNDNGIYTAPTSMHPASIHPIPSAAALGPGQAPFFLSSLNISSSSNREAVTASEAYLKAVEAHVLDAVQKSYNPNEQPINEHMHDEAATKLSRYQAYGPGVRCGEGIIYPTLTHKLSAASEGSTPTSFQGEDDTAFPCSPFLSCHAHFTAADLRVAINIRNVDYGSFPGAFGNEHSAAGLVPGFRPQKKEGRLVVLCPTRVPAIFARWYGEPSETVSRKQAAAEQAEVADAVPLFADLLGEHGSSLYHDVGGDRWALCTLSSNVEVVWPGSLLLCRRRSTHRHSHASTAEKLSRPILPDRMRSTMAKASPRVPRNLYFRPFRDRSGDLAAMTVKYIDFFNQEKVKDRRTKAEKQLAEQSSSSVSSDLHENPPSEQTQTISSERGSMQVVSGPSQDDFSPDSRQCGTDAGNTDRLVNELGCPTIDTISSVLDSLLDSAVDTPQGSGGILSPHGSGMTGASVDQESTHCKAADGSMIYPTPQSGPNSANQASAAPAGTTDAFEGSARPTSPLQNESRSLADILGDFTWSNYTDGLAPLQQATSRPVSSSGGAGAYGIRGVFDDPSTFDLFDSGGLTEEDFSFFDSPMAADISLPQSSTHFVPQEPLDLTEITADEIASFVNTAGPIDHFGHLMPQSDQGLLVKPIQPNDPSGPDTTQFEARQLQDFGSYEAATPFSGAEIISTAAGWDSVHTKISPPTARKYHVRCADPFSGGTQLEQIICSSQSSLQAILRSPFGPIRLLLPSPHLPDSASCLKNGNSQENENDALSTYNGMPLRAERIRAAISGPPLSTRNGEDVFSSKRDWQAAELPVESSSDESIYASSDEDCAAWVDKRLHRPVRARSPKHARRLSPKSLLELAFFYHLPNQDESPAAEVHARNKEGPVKINRGEKEAVATIFFQHTIENIDFRERRSIEVRGASALAQLSCAIIPFGSPKLSRKLASALPTEIAAYHRHALTTLSISALRSWSKLGLGPRNGVKDVQAIVVAPKDLLDDTSRSALGDWLKRVGAIWQDCGFGNHASGPLKDCVFSLDCGASTFRDGSNVQSKLLEISELHRPMGSNARADFKADADASICERISGEHNCIIYVLVEDVECQSPSSNLVYLCLRLHLLRKGAIPHIVPLSAIACGSDFLSVDAAQSLHRSAITRFVFNVYDRLPVCVNRSSAEKKGPNAVSALMPDAFSVGGHVIRAFVAPAFHLASHSAPQVSLQLHWPPPALDVMDAHRLLHIAYELSTDRKWLYLTAVDDKAEYNCLRVRFIEGLETRVVLRRVWNFLKEASECATVEWRICICRVGALYAEEIQAWSEIMQSGVSQFAHPCVVTICSVSSTASSTCAMSQQANPSPSVIYNGTSTTNMRGTYYCDGQPLVYISHSQYPTPVYTASHLDTDQLPGLSQRLYYALASSSLYFPASTTDCEKTVRPAIFPATTAYKIDLLAIATHPLSSYNRQLASHMSDIAQSFVDLHVLAKERWAMNSGPASSFTLSRLPWHLASIAHMTDSDLEALLPA